MAIITIFAKSCTREDIVFSIQYKVFSAESKLDILFKPCYINKQNLFEITVLINWKKVN